jgi:hypothetical protein
MYIIYFSQVIVRALDKMGGLYECFFGGLWSMVYGVKILEDLWVIDMFEEREGVVLILDLVTFRLEAIINLKSDNSRDQFEERDRF